MLLVRYLVVAHVAAVAVKHIGTSGTTIRRDARIRAIATAIGSDLRAGLAVVHAIARRADHRWVDQGARAIAMGMRLPARHAIFPRIARRWLVTHDRLNRHRYEWLLGRRRQTAGKRIPIGSRIGRFNGKPVGRALACQFRTSRWLTCSCCNSGVGMFLRLDMLARVAP